MSLVSAVGGEFLVNTLTLGNQFLPAIASLENGGFVASWTSRGEIRAQVFAADGSRAGGEFDVNSSQGIDKQDPVVAGLANGGFVVSWTDGSVWQGDGSGSSIRAQLFAANGSLVGGEFVVNTIANDSQST